jgi:carbonic anhydrase
MTPEDLLNRNEEWRKKSLDKDPGCFEQLSEGQQPEILMIACSDSRVSPSILFGADLGELFIHRNIANQIKSDDENILSILEYSIDVLKVKHIIVLGHYGCGGVRAAMDPCKESHVCRWVKPIQGIAENESRDGDPLTWNQLVERNTFEQLDNIRGTDVYKRAMAKGDAPVLCAWVNDISTGRIIPLTEHVKV